MRLRFDVSFGSDSRRKAVVRKKDAGVLYPVGGTSRGGWWPVIRESFTGAWQRNIEVNFDSALAFHAVYSCVTLISNDFGKLANVLYEWDDDERIWLETDSPAFSPVLRKPNKYQNHVQFKEWYAMSKLLRGNVYVLKERDQRGVVIAEYVLDPNRVKPLVTEDGSVYYQLGADNLVNDLIEVERVVPASEIIHDRMNCLYHPLVGVSPLFACGLAAMQGLAIQNNSTTFFGNQSRPSGILTAPGHIKKATADRLKENWEANYSGANYGKVAILGDDLKYQPLSVSAADAQMVEQLKMSGGDCLPLLSRAALQDRAAAHAGGRQCGTGEPDLLLRLPAIAHRAVRGVPGRGPRDRLRQCERGHGVRRGPRSRRPAEDGHEDQGRDLSGGRLGRTLVARRGAAATRPAAGAGWQVSVFAAAEL